MPTANGPIELSIVVPAYNEEARVGVMLRQTRAFLDTLNLPYEIIVVDDGSTDKTAAVAAACLDRRGAVVRLERNRGKGAAVRTGVMRAVGDYIMYVDADGSSRIEHLTRLRDAIDAGADVAIGSRINRGHTESTVVKRWHRHLFGQTFNFIVRTLLVPGIYDTQCGFKMFRRDAARAVFAAQQLDTYAFDVEVLYRCRRDRYTVVEIPIDWTDVAGSKVQLVRDPIRMLIDVCRIPFFDDHARRS